MAETNAPRVDTQLNIAKPKAEIFEAIVNPEHMKHYFITSGDGRLDGGAPVTWFWEDHGGAELQINPREMRDPDRIVFAWEATGTETTVTIELVDGGDGDTLVKVSDLGLPPGEESVGKCLEQMQGWMHMLCCLKAYLEFGINLRKGEPVRVGAE